MSKVKIVSIIYAIGIIIGALFFDVWGADTTPFKTLSVFACKYRQCFKWSGVCTPNIKE